MAQPVPAARQVLVRVHAASINDWDWGLLNGPTFPWQRGAPRQRILGSDIAGEVVEVGSGVRRFKRGDRVYGDLSGFGKWGGFAEYVCASEKRLVLKSPRMTFVQAAALPQAGQLAVQALAAAGPPKEGRTILINGAGGGVGTIGVQLAKAQGAVVTGVDSAAKFETMRRAGFDHVIDYTKEDFTRIGRRYDLIVDTKTTRQPFDYIRALNPRGTYATVGGPSMPHLLKIPLVGWWYRLTTGRTIRIVGLRPNRDLAYMNQQFEKGRLVPVIDGPYPLSEGREALRRFGAGEHLGKIVLII